MKPLFHPVVLFLYLLPCVALSQTAPLPTPPLPPPPAPSPVVQSLRNKAYDALEPAQRVYDTCKSCYQGYRYREDDTPFDTTFFMSGVFDIFT